MTTITAFKAYDLRGRIPTELNADVAYRVARGYAQFLKPKRVCVGRDIRLSSAELASSADPRPHGVRRRRGRHRPVRHRGQSTTRPSRSARRRHHGHGEPQPARLQRHEVRARGLAADHGRHRACRTSAASPRRARSPPAARAGRCQPRRHRPERYIEHLLSYVDRRTLKPLKIVVQRRQRRRRPRSSTRSSRTCRSSSSSSSTSRTAASRTACRTRCSSRTTRRP